MDETFNDEVVHFNYKTNDGQVHDIETLEILEYGDFKLNIQPAASEPSAKIANKQDAPINITELKELKPGQKIIRDTKPELATGIFLATIW